MCQLISKTVTPRGRARHRFELCFIYKGTKYRALDLKLRIDSARAFISLVDRDYNRPLLDSGTARLNTPGLEMPNIFAADRGRKREALSPATSRETHAPRADATKEVVDIRGGSRDGNFVVAIGLIRANC